MPSGNKPERRRANQLPEPAQPVNYDDATPKFCLGFLQSVCNVSNLAQEQQASFAVTLQEQAKATWKELTLRGRHAGGLEHFPASQIKKQIPDRFSDEKKFSVFRYIDDNRPMIGVRVRDVFHILWIEKDFGDVYDHR